ncbi:UV-damaged DNA-binding protein RAD7 [Ascoidea rubescens DSM 1968]|uniref:RNI-like protein n=1 Tax=Ascoidea rubescens DSM 1968 TaxID=1344418 RepID=A0A1D2VAM8_9ASCO|nr:RNI-like protein [Ascoidea rubescens DSM 1968]ODV58615.1 RNI-like protein [Ascoidea rubescens DSM 1968]
MSVFRSRNESVRIKGPTSALSSYLRHHNIGSNLRRNIDHNVDIEEDAQHTEPLTENAEAPQDENSIVQTEEAQDATETTARTATRRETRARGGRGSFANFQRNYNRILARNNQNSDHELNLIQNADGLENSDDPENSDDLENADEIAEDMQIEIAFRRKRKLNIDSNNELSEHDNEDGYDSQEETLLFALRGPGQKSICIGCARGFVIDVYCKQITENTRYFFEKYNSQTGYLCPICTKEIDSIYKKRKKNQLAARKKRLKVAAALLNKQEYKLPSLQDLCIQLVSKHIDNIDELGEVGFGNLSKISMALSKNRSLNTRTAKLFFHSDLKELNLYDCSNVGNDALRLIGSYCPNIESLNLNMCGQLHSDTLLYFATNLKNLHSISLNGCFLIDDTAWNTFFETINTRLKRFDIKNTHRFGNDSLVSLIKNCGESLQELTLSRLDGLTDPTAFQILGSDLHKLELLELSYPNKEEFITNELIISILANNGSTLTSLNLDGCSGLGDSFLINGIRPFCSILTSLSLRYLDLITDEGVCKLFSKWDLNAGLMHLDLQKCVSLGDTALVEILTHSADYLITLNINSVYEITSDFWAVLKYVKLNLLTSLNAGFVRSMNDSTIEFLGRSCPNLSLLEVYGANKCTSKAIIRKGLTVIGRQSDSI